MKAKEDYSPPEIGTVLSLRSQYAEDVRLAPIKIIAAVLENNGLISDYMKPVGFADVYIVELDRYRNRIPSRKHADHWIDGGKQVSVYHPIICLPFFLNNSGSIISRLFNKDTSVGQILNWAEKRWSQSKENLDEDIMKFLLLLEELDLIELKDVST